MLTLEHIGICAKDTVKLKDWYIEVFGFTIVYENKKEMPTFFLKLEDGNMIEIYGADTLLEGSTNKHQGIRHLALATDNIEKEYQNLLDKDVEIIEELKTNDKGIKTAFFKDIEGNIIHFIQRPQPL